MWDAFVYLAQQQGHKVICATMRHPDTKEGPPVKKALAGKGVDIYFTGRKAKHTFLKDLGIEPAIWIDDNPHWIVMDHIETWGPHYPLENYVKGGI